MTRNANVLLQSKAARDSVHSIIASYKLDILEKIPEVEFQRDYILHFPTGLICLHINYRTGTSVVE